VFVLLVGWIYEVWREMASGGMTYIQRFMTIGSGIQVILRELSQKFEGCKPE
jgi:hypothetical protein